MITFELLRNLTPRESIDWPKSLEQSGTYPMGYVYPFSLNLPKRTLVKIFEKGLVQDHVNCGGKVRGITPLQINQAAQNQSSRSKSL